MTLRAVPRPAHPCVLLTIDSSEEQGWCVRKRGKLIRSGIVRSVRDRVSAIACAKEQETDRSPLIVIFESVAPCFTSAVDYGRWLEQLDLAGHPVMRTTTVLYGVWHRALRRSSVEIGTPEKNAIAIGIWAQHAQEVFDMLPRKPAHTFAYWIPKVYDSSS